MLIKMTSTTSALRQICENLKSCTSQLETDVQYCWKEISEHFKNFTESDFILDNAIDYHYKEILEHLKEIKNHIEIVTKHEVQVRTIRSKIFRGDIEKNSNRKSIKIDRDYIKKQIDTFQNLDAQNSVHRREVKSHNRTSHNSSMKYLDTWEKFLEKNTLEDKPPAAVDKKMEVRRRPNETLRKKKKFVSSTMDMFLDSRNSSGVLVDENRNLGCFGPQEDNIEEEPESDTEDYLNGEYEILENVNHDHSHGILLDTKPKIIDVVLKKSAETSTDQNT